jgi:hypothetical protein
MSVQDSDHQRMGRVRRCWDDYFEVRRGVFFEHVWMVPFSDVCRTRGSTVELVRPSAEEAEVLAGTVMRGHEAPGCHSANDTLQHWMDAHARSR